MLRSLELFHVVTAIKRANGADRVFRVRFPPVNKGGWRVRVPTFVDDLVKVQFTHFFVALALVTQGFSQLDAGFSIHIFRVLRRYSRSKRSWRGSGFFCSHGLVPGFGLWLGR